MFTDIKSLALRAIEFVFTLVILGVCGNMIAKAIRGNPSSVNFAFFAGLWALLTLLVVAAAAFIGRIRSGLRHLLPTVILVFDALATLFSLIAGIALAARLGAHRCSDAKYTERNRITNGARDRTGRCRSAQATTAFLFFNSALFAASTFLSFLLHKRESGPVIAPSNVGSGVGSGVA